MPGHMSFQDQPASAGRSSPGADDGNFAGSLFGLPGQPPHERVLLAADAQSGLRAILALHSTARGPAFGGCRLWRYESEAAALTDALAAGRRDEPEERAGRPAVRRRQGRHHRAARRFRPRCTVRRLRPRRAIARRRLHHRRRRRHDDRRHAARARADRVRQRHSARRRRLRRRPQPEDRVGRLRLDSGRPSGCGCSATRSTACASRCRGWVRSAGIWPNCCTGPARGSSSPMSTPPRSSARSSSSARSASTVDQILGADVDVLAPCALGAVLDARSVPQIRARLIAGAANNQLADARRWRCAARPRHPLSARLPGQCRRHRQRRA